MFRLQLLQCLQIGTDVLSNCGVRTPASFDGSDAVVGESVVALEEFGVFAGEDIVCDCCYVVGWVEGSAELEEECGFSGTDGSGLKF